MRLRSLALTEGIAAGILFGTAAIFIRYLNNLDALSIVFWRLTIACLGLVIVLMFQKKPFSFNLLRKSLKELCLLSVFLSLHFIFFVSAVKDTTILNATVLVNTTPIFSMLVSSFLFGTKPSRFALTGLAISFIGVIIIAYAEIQTSGLAFCQPNCPSTLKGDLEAVAAALVEAFYLNYGRKVRNQMNVLHAMFPIYLFSAITVGILSLCNGINVLAFSATVKNILPLIGLGLIPTAMAHTLYFSSLSSLESFETATMALLEPIGATILGISLFQEIPEPTFAFGAGLILFGILVTVKTKVRARNGIKN